jgi:hypothetical protein
MQEITSINSENEGLREKRLCFDKHMLRKTHRLKVRWREGIRSCSDEV